MLKIPQRIFFRESTSLINHDIYFNSLIVLKALTIGICILSIISCNSGSQPTAPIIPPEAKPPAIDIKFPTEYPYNLVGDNVVLTVEAGTIRAKWVQAIIDDRIVGNGQAVQYGYVIDVSDFGTQGQKTLIIRAGNEAGTADDSIIIKNNETALTNEAMNFIRNYWSDLYDGTLIRFDSTTIYVKNRDLPKLQPDIEQALDYWRKWSGLNFIVTEREDLRPIIFIMRGDGPAAVPGFQVAKIWLEEYYLLFWASPTDRLWIICHEMGHAIGISHHPIDGSIMDDTAATYLHKIRLHPYQQKAVKIVYSLPPRPKL